MKILESPLMGAFIAYMMANWSRRLRVDQSRRRLRHPVAMVRAVADDAELRAGGADAAAVRDDSFSTWLRLLRTEALRGQEALDAAAMAGSARRFLAGLRYLFGRSDEMDRLAEAVEELELLTAPGGAVDRLFSVFGHRGTTTARGTDMVHMDVDGVPPAGGARHRHGEASGGAESIVAGAGLPVPGAKRKRGVEPGSTSHGVVDTAERQKRRRVLPWMRHSASFSSCFLAAPPPRQLGSSSEDRARTVALAMARVRRRIGMPTRRRRQAVLRQHCLRFSVQ